MIFIDFRRFLMIFFLQKPIVKHVGTCVGCVSVITGGQGGLEALGVAGAGAFCQSWQWFLVVGDLKSLVTPLILAAAG